MTVILLTVDLTVISTVDGAAARMGATCRAASNDADAIARCARATADLLVIDLGTPSLDVKSLIEQVKATATSPPRIVAFGPHVHVEKLAAARDAGCDEVMSRGQFFAHLDAVLKGNSTN
jgi:DNA-binding response OmpR family regulator